MTDKISKETLQQQGTQASVLMPQAMCGCDDNGSPNAGDIAYLQTQLDNKVDKEVGMGLSANNFTDELRQKLDTLHNYDDTKLSAKIDELTANFNSLVNSNPTAAIESFNEIIAFLAEVTDSETLKGIIAGIELQIANVQAQIDGLESGSAEITDGSVTTDKIAGLAVTEAKLSSNAVTSAKIASNAVTSAKIASNAVTSAKIASYCVTEDKLTTNSVTTSKIKDEAITIAKLNSSLLKNLSSLNQNLITDHGANDVINNTFYYIVIESNIKNINTNSYNLASTIYITGIYKDGSVINSMIGLVHGLSTSAFQGKIKNFGKNLGFVYLCSKQDGTLCLFINPYASTASSAPKIKSLRVLWQITADNINHASNINITTSSTPENAVPSTNYIQLTTQ